MAQRHVVERLVDARLNVFRAADAHLRVACVGHPSAGGHELVRKRHVALGGVDGKGCHNSLQGFGVAEGVGDGGGVGGLGLGRCEPGAHRSRLEEGDEPERDGAVLILEGDGVDVPVEHA